MSKDTPNPRIPRLLIIGHAQHGKDTLAELLADMGGLKFMSSSLSVGEKFIWPAWGKDRYEALPDMMADRVNHRSTWFNLIAAYNTPDLTRTARDLLEVEGCNMYVGMRRRAELEACKEAGLFDHIIWIDASKRKPMEPKDSMELLNTDATLFIDNNGSKRDLEFQTDRMLKHLQKEGFHIPGMSEKKTFPVQPIQPVAAKNQLIFEPSIFAIGQTQFIERELARWIEHNGLVQLSGNDNTPLGRLWRDVTEEDAIARMIEFGGRHCYRAWEKGRDREAYISNIIEMEHGSVLEHASINWGIQGVSRSLSLELARHRVGIAFSQESQRYVDASDINFVVPPILLHMADHHDNASGILDQFLEDNLDMVKRYVSWQEFIRESYSKDMPSDVKKLSMLQKRANEAARAVLPNDTETRFLWTTNMRILSHFLWLRGGVGADLEIRRLAVALLKKAQQYAPEIFNRMTTKQVEDSYGVPVIVSADS